ncbi:energy transducer TonB [Xylophilus sp. ASV27]|uniref:energy transducer TonB n=1 Tax=Xylophilus sp. ASV27 TaxID=2795129 RepID=UPI0018EC1971|nr:energy transducer TonB [Xylophilus sp. ASV27]
MTASQRYAPAPRISRNAAIVGGVVLFHVAVLWAIQSGLVQRAIDIVVPAEIISEIITPPEPQIPPAPPPPAPKPAPTPAPQVKKAPPPPAPRPVAIADPTPSPNAPTGVTTPQPPAPPIEAPAPAPSPPPAPPAPPAPPQIVLPSSDADYLQNPKPAYPAISKRLGEQGKVEIRVLINAQGQPERAEISKSSGYERLDKQAYETVLKWRFTPGKRNGVAEAMWFKVPINFVLE